MAQVTSNANKCANEDVTASSTKRLFANKTVLPLLSTFSLAYLHFNSVGPLLAWHAFKSVEMCAPTNVCSCQTNLEKLIVPTTCLGYWYPVLQCTTMPLFIMPCIDPPRWHLWDPLYTTSTVPGRVNIE